MCTATVEPRLEQQAALLVRFLKNIWKGALAALWILSTTKS